MASNNTCSAALVSGSLWDRLAAHRRWRIGAVDAAAVRGPPPPARDDPCVDGTAAAPVHWPPADQPLAKIASLQQAAGRTAAPRTFLRVATAPIPMITICGADIAGEVRELKPRRPDDGQTTVAKRLSPRNNGPLKAGQALLTDDLPGRRLAARRACAGSR